MLCSWGGTSSSSSVEIDDSFSPENAKKSEVSHICSVRNIQTAFRVCSHLLQFTCNEPAAFHLVLDDVDGGERKEDGAEHFDALIDEERPPHGVKVDCEVAFRLFVVEGRELAASVGIANFLCSCQGLS